MLTVAPDVVLQHLYSSINPATLRAGQPAARSFDTRSVVYGSGSCDNVWLPGYAGTFSVCTEAGLVMVGSSKPCTQPF